MRKPTWKRVVATPRVIHDNNGGDLRPGLVQPGAAEAAAAACDQNLTRSAGFAQSRRTGFDM